MLQKWDAVFPTKKSRETESHRRQTERTEKQTEKRGHEVGGIANRSFYLVKSPLNKNESYLKEDY